MNEDKKAITDFTKAIELEPDNLEHYNQRGTPHHKTGEYEKAIADFTKAIELGPQHPDCHIERGYVYYKMGKYQEMIQDCNEAVEKSPSSGYRAYFYIERGCAYWLLGERDKARADFVKAVELDPENKCYLEELGKEFRDTNCDVLGFYHGGGIIFFLHAILKPKKSDK